MTRTRSEARRRAAHGHRDPYSQAGIAIGNPDHLRSGPRVTHGSSAGSPDGMPTKRHTVRHTGDPPLAQNLAHQSPPGASQEETHAAKREQPTTPRLPSFQPPPYAPPMQQMAPTGQSAASPHTCNQPTSISQPMQQSAFVGQHQQQHWAVDHAYMQQQAQPTAHQANGVVGQIRASCAALFGSICRAYGRGRSGKCPHASCVLSCSPL